MNAFVAGLPRPMYIGVIFKKELRSYFNSPIAYVLMVAFLGIVGWFFTSNLFLINVASLRGLFELIPAVFLFFIPAITMRLLAEEKKSGTFELLVTKPLQDAEVVLGKFFAAWTLTACLLLPTVLYYFTMAPIGKVDLGPVLGGYLGMLLLAGVYVAIGLFASSLTDNQIIAFIVGFLFMAILFLVDKVLIYFPAPLADTLEYLGIDYHVTNIARGIIDSRDVVYFLSMLTAALSLTVFSLERRKW